jgi:hypothetical protein
VLSRKSIARFAREGGRVSVWIRGKKAEERCRPKHSVFWVHHGWDNPSERGYMRLIESEFQLVADAVLAGHRDLSEPQHLAITKFQRLWALRFALQQFPAKDSELSGLIPAGPPLTQIQQENLEANGYGYLVGNVLRSQQLAGMTISMGLLALNRSEAVMRTKWAIITSRDIEFLVPDSFRTYWTVPLSPQCCFMANHPANIDISPETAIALNNIAATQCVGYCFAHDFSNTGVDIARSLSGAKSDPHHSPIGPIMG